MSQIKNKEPINKTIKNKSSNKKILNTGIIIKPSKINNKNLFYFSLNR